MFESYILKKILDESYNGISKIIKEHKRKIVVSKNDFEDSINHHLKFVKNWSSEVSFKDIYETKDIHKTFVELDYYLTPRRSQLYRTTEKKVKLLQAISEERKHLIIIGQPGAGKTTSMKYICNSLLFYNQFELKDYNFPIVIRLRELTEDTNINFQFKENSIYNKLYNILGLNISFMPDEKENVTKPIIERVVSNIIDDLNVLLVLDGFDELEKSIDRKKVINDIRNLFLTISNSRILLTSRCGEFHYDIENSKLFEISPLSQNQITSFAKKWINDDPKAKLFLKQISLSPFSDTAIRPLTLGHLCTIFERYGKIPEKPKTVYKKVINLLLEDWDLQRSITRNSKYANFEIDRKSEFLSNLAFYLTTIHNKISFSEREIETVYIQICENFGLPKKEVKKVVDEIETHNGLFIQVGSEIYEFAHKSIQEYLAAEYLIKLPTIPNSKILLLSIPNELALTISISSNPTLFFFILLLGKLKKNIIHENFTEVLLNRILVEKPDFNHHPLLSLTLLTVYSDVISSTKSDNYKNIVIALIDKFFELGCVHESYKILLKYYDAYQDSNNTILERVEDLENIDNTLLPKRLLSKY